METQENVAKPEEAVEDFRPTLPPLYDHETPFGICTRTTWHPGGMDGDGHHLEWHPEGMDGDGHHLDKAFYTV